ncbi:hypothetical protein V492_04949 [Pseudogymnoascus sp. VKM F-4246]|nr:hypothetical protein V492_04949 [Pseudogymnoascus sp. VKM F-4246]
MKFDQFRPTAHFIAPHSWSNDPCGAVYIPEIKEYLFCYQWNPGTTEGGNSAWGMARSKDLVTWEDCSPAIQNGVSYDSHGVFSGSIVSRLVNGKRTLYLFYTSVSALPIHWSKKYIEGCETQSVAFSEDFGRSWQRYQKNPLIRVPPKLSLTTGWRDPFVSPWAPLSKLLGINLLTDYMMISSGERGHGPQLHLYRSTDLLEWKPLSTILDVEFNSSLSATTGLNLARNFECSSFFTLNQKNYLIVGLEEDSRSSRHNGHVNMWLGGTLELENGVPKFNISNHGILDSGVLYAAHIFYDAEGRLLQLGWADETAKRDVVKEQGWAGCLTHPRELYQIAKPITALARSESIWDIDEKRGTMTTVGVRPASQLRGLKPNKSFTALSKFKKIQGKHFEIEATFSNLSGNEKLSFNVRESPDSVEVTKITFDKCTVTVDRTYSSVQKLGASSPNSGALYLLPGEDLHIQIWVDGSIVEVFANGRCAITSRVYPSLDTSIGASYDFGGFNEENVQFECWEGLKNAWPGRQLDQRLRQDIACL